MKKTRLVRSCIFLGCLVAVGNVYILHHNTQQHGYLHKYNNNNDNNLEDETLTTTEGGASDGGGTGGSASALSASPSDDRLELRRRPGQYLKHSRSNANDNANANDNDIATIKNGTTAAAAAASSSSSSSSSSTTTTTSHFLPTPHEFIILSQAATSTRRRRQRQRQKDQGQEQGQEQNDGVQRRGSMDTTMSGWNATTTAHSRMEQQHHDGQHQLVHPSYTDEAPSSSSLSSSSSSSSYVTTTTEETLQKLANYTFMEDYRTRKEEEFRQRELRRRQQQKRRQERRQQKQQQQQQQIDDIKQASLQGTTYVHDERPDMVNNNNNNDDRGHKGSSRGIYGRGSDNKNDDNIHNYKNDNSTIFNDFDQTRYFCGQPILPHTGLSIMDDETVQQCPPNQRISRLWPITNHHHHRHRHHDDETLPQPHTNQNGLEPIQLHWNNQDGGRVSTFHDCNVPCTYTGRFGGTHNFVKVQDLPLEFVAWSMEGEGYYPQLKLDPRGHQHRRYYATTSFQSDIPLPYYSEAEYDIQTGHAPLSWDDPTVIRGASFIAKNCGSRSGREAIVQDMMELTGSPPPLPNARRHGQRTTTLAPLVVSVVNNATDMADNGNSSSLLAMQTPPFVIHSLSSCLRNAELPPEVDRQNKTELMRRYLFHLSFENSITDDYVTEKLWGTLRAGTIPVYHGAPNIREHVPPNSVIFVHDFASTHELVGYMAAVAYNQTLYESYHAWRFRPLPDYFHRKYDMTRAHSICRVCRFSWAVKYGWRWDHASQQVMDTHVSRTTCLDRSTNLLVKPAQEEYRWSTDVTGNKQRPFGSSSLTNEIEDNTNNVNVDCNISDKKTLAIDGTPWERTVVDHDGVTDMEIVLRRHQKDGNDKSSATAWTLRVPINSSVLVPRPTKATSDRPVYWLQDDQSRVVLAFDRAVDLKTSLVSNGEITIPITQPFRMRLLVVDLDTNPFHEDGKHQESYFESIMLDDFFRPLRVGSQSIHEWVMMNQTVQEVTQ